MSWPGLSVQSVLPVLASVQTVLVAVKPCLQPEGAPACVTCAAHFEQSVVRVPTGKPWRARTRMYRPVLGTCRVVGRSCVLGRDGDKEATLREKKSGRQSCCPVKVTWWVVGAVGGGHQ